MNKYNQFLPKIDKDYHAMVGLSKRMKLPEKLEVEEAKALKIKMQERVMELWNLHQSSLSSTLDMERIL